MTLGNGSGRLTIPRHQTALTLIELITTIAIITLLMSLILTGLRHSRSSARTTACINNFHQLNVTWNLYAADHQERLVSNVHLNLTNGWVRGVLQGEGATNLLHLVSPKEALFAPYISTSETYLCPADESTEEIANIPHQRVRSVSMNQAMGYESYAVWLPSKALARPGQRSFRVYRLSSDIREPSRRFVFVDEGELTINDPAFAVEMPQPNQRARWVDVPTTRHRQSGVLAFADGHVEAHRWLDPRTATDHFDKSTEDNPDWRWLTERTSGE